MQRKLFQTFSFCVLGLTCLPALAFAQTFIAGNPSNREVSIPLSAAMAGSKVVVTVVGQGADHQNLSITLQGPAGLSMAVKSMTVRNEAAVIGSYSKDAILTKYYDTSALSFNKVSKTQTRAASDLRDPACGCRTPAEIATGLEIFGEGFTREQFCAFLPVRTSCDEPAVGDGGNTGSGNDGNSEILRGTFSAFIQSNRCLKGGKPAAAIELDLAGVAAANLQGEIRIKTSMSVYGGNRRASIKERSDGGIFPGEPLLLIAPVYGEGAAVGFAKYSGRRQTSLKILPTPSRGGLIPYKGFSYLRFPISKYLTGGEGVFQIAAGGKGYSICTNLVRKRQRFNGYPMNG